MARAVATLAMAAVVAACGGFIPEAGTGPIVDIPGVGSAALVELQPLGPDDEGGGFAPRWTGARAVLPAEDDRVLIAWAGGPLGCWIATAVHFDARGRQLAASIEEHQPGALNGRTCGGDRDLWAVLVPSFAIPLPGGVSDWPPVPVDPNAEERP